MMVYAYVHGTKKFRENELSIQKSVFKRLRVEHCIHKYFLAILDRLGYISAYTLHQTRGFESESACSAFSYLSISFFVLSLASSG